MQPSANDVSTSGRGGPAGQDRPAATSRSAALLLDLGSDLLQLRHDLSAECRDATFDDALDLREGGKLLGDLSRDLAWERAATEAAATRIVGIGQFVRSTDDAGSG